MKKRSNLILVGLVFLLIVAVVTLGGPLLDTLLLPWAFERDGRPALTGSWVGTLTTATRRPYGMMIDLRLPEARGRRGLTRDWEFDSYGQLAGMARLCDEAGRVYAYTVEGEPEDRQAKRLTLHATPSDSPIPEGLTLSWISGEWDDADRLDLVAQLDWRQDGAAISGPEYPDTQSDATLVMTRGDEAAFQSICSRVQ